MAKLDSLIRYHKHELDEQQKQLSELNSLAQKIEQDIEALEEQKQKEMDASQNDPMFASTLPGYLQRCKKKKEELELSLQFVEEKIIETTDLVRDKFAELKKYELVQQRRQEEAEQKRLKSENQEFDEIGIEGHRRKSTKKEN